MSAISLDTIMWFHVKRKYSIFSPDLQYAADCFIKITDNVENKFC